MQSVLGISSVLLPTLSRQSPGMTLLQENTVSSPSLDILTVPNPSPGNHPGRNKTRCGILNPNKEKHEPIWLSCCRRRLRPCSRIVSYQPHHYGKKPLCPHAMSLVVRIVFLVVHQNHHRQSCCVCLANSTSHAGQMLAESPSEPKVSRKTHHVLRISAITALSPQCEHQALAKTSLSLTPNASTTNTCSSSI